ncbi:MAG: adenine phosphoribosyltransferase [Bacteroidetes bacterium]|nr:adenine phosphoribosyltransferase [Bacteroidota bacterium]
MNREESINYLKEITRSIEDHPKEGIVFRDLTTVFQDAKAMGIVTNLLSASVCENGNEPPVDKLVAIEARGFLLAGAISGRIGGGIVMVRKAGKLPAKKRKIAYQLEYGEDALEIHEDAIRPGERVFIIDDLLATGGTAEAGCKLVESLGGIVEKILFLVELPELAGRKKLAAYNIESIYSFEGG